VPPNVRRSIEEWGAQIERVTLRRETPLLHARDAAALDALYADPELAPLLGRRVAPAVALVSSAQLLQLGERLAARGHLPALDEGPGAAAGPQVDVDAHGRLTFRQHLPSVYVLRAVRRFADGDGEDFRLSATSLRRAAKAGLTADDVLAELERLHAGALPEAVAALVRRWTKDWGRGALFETTLLQVEQPDTLADLLADPQVRPLIQPLPGAPTLALVRPEAVERLRELLGGFGMAVEGRLMRP
jgi:hypothetical protein